MHLICRFAVLAFLIRIYWVFDRKENLYSFFNSSAVCKVGPIIEMYTERI